jgi:hypothetical protein
MAAGADGFAGKIIEKHLTDGKIIWAVITKDF